jgi:hypothetical protein
MASAGIVDPLALLARYDNQEGKRESDARAAGYRPVQEWMRELQEPYERVRVRFYRMHLDGKVEKVKVGRVSWYKIPAP